MTAEERAKEISPQEKARIFGMYLGCPLYTGSGNLDILLGVNMNGDVFFTSGRLYVEHCQLILRDLSEITDEDAIACYDMWTGRADGRDNPHRVELMKIRIVDHNVIEYQQADYLRNKGYALSLSGNSLFDLGIEFPLLIFLSFYKSAQIRSIFLAPYGKGFLWVYPEVIFQPNIYVYSSPTSFLYSL